MCIYTHTCITPVTNTDTNVMPNMQIEVLDTVALNLHRIDKDVQRCDRNYHYFTTGNLEKLRNIMCRSGSGQVPSNLSFETFFSRTSSEMSLFLLFSGWQLCMGTSRDGVCPRHV